ncbi:MAG: tRNA pseudouridine(38-40) synthase TruA [Methanotrichaceae archaeon]
MRVALKLAYLGHRYHGFQRQPQVLTVESVVRKGLLSLGLAEQNFCYAGRTDQGVNALGQVITFSLDEDMAHLAIPRVINSRLPPDVWTWAYAMVPDDFSARHGALWRKYRYALYRKDLDLDTMQQAAQNLIGIHDFKNFSTEKMGCTDRNLMSLEIKEQNDFVLLEIKSNGFLWNMARKMVTALEMIGSGEKELEWIHDLLNPALNQGVAAAPPEGLMLVDVFYPGIEWTDDLYSKRMASERLARTLRPQMALAETTEEIFRSML